MARYNYGTDYMTSPDYQWSTDDLQQMESLGNQIEAISIELQRLDEAWMLADDNLDVNACELLEPKIRELTDMLDDLQSQYDSIGE
jgi:hypothetical protein